MLCFSIVSCLDQLSTLFCFVKPILCLSKFTKSSSNSFKISVLHAIAKKLQQLSVPSSFSLVQLRFLSFLACTLTTVNTCTESSIICAYYYHKECARFNPINPGLFGLELALGGVFHPSCRNSFVFEPMRPNFGTEIL